LGKWGRRSRFRGRLKATAKAKCEVSQLPPRLCSGSGRDDGFCEWRGGEQATATTNATAGPSTAAAKAPPSLRMTIFRVVRKRTGNGKNLRGKGVRSQPSPDQAGSGWGTRSFLGLVEETRQRQRQRQRQKQVLRVQRRMTIPNFGVEYSPTWGWGFASNGQLMTKAGLPMNRFEVVAGRRVVGVALGRELGALGLEPAFKGRVELALGPCWG
jgi:hypothetical protein